MVDVYEVQIIQDPDTGVVQHESWRLDGKLHRVGAPALINRDPDTGVAYQEEWRRHNLRHRNDGPALIYRDRKSGATVSEHQYTFGTEDQVEVGAPAEPSI